MTPDTPWLSAPEQRAWRGLLHMHAELTARLGRHLQATSELSLADFEVLVALTDVPEARRRVLELGRDLQWEKSRLSHHLTRMEKRGLVAREECPSDGRGAFVVVTDAGRAAIEAAAPAHVTEVRRLVFDVLDDAEVGVLGDLTERVVERLQTLDRPDGPDNPDSPAHDCAGPARGRARRRAS
jgi:DNA-binding MarR family transcriptional regulator